MKIFISILLTLACLSNGTTFSQTKKPKKPASSQKKFGELSWEKKLETANKLFEEGNYYAAIKYYKDVIQERPENYKAIYNLAESYFRSFDYEHALPLYKQLSENKERDYPLSPFQYALNLKYNGKYSDAKKAFNEFIKNYRGRDSQEYEEKVKREIEGCDFALKAKDNPAKVKIYNLGKEINSAYTEIAPLPYGDSILYFSALPSDSVIITTKSNESDYLIQMYKSYRRGKKWTKPELLPSSINNKKDQTGNGCFSLDKKKFYFTRCSENKEGVSICEIYSSNFRDGKMDEAVKLPNEINLPGFSSRQAAIGIGSNGEELLYFVSDRPGGVGGADIWYAVVNKNGSFSTPVNSGGVINTQDDEITPFYHVPSKMIYYSSNGMSSMGNFDIYKSQGLMNKWYKPENIGLPFNSPVDDTYFVLDENNTGDGYLASNREGSITVKNKTCCQDIYRFEKIRPPDTVYAVRGFVYQEGDSTLTPIEGALITFSKENIIAADTSRKSKMYHLKLEKESDYKITVIRQGYFQGTAMVSTKGLTKSDTLIQHIYLSKIEIGKEYVLEDIYYDFNKATLRPESEKSLNNLINLLNDNPNVVIEIGSHTDNIGSDSYNLKLSQKRAESVLKFLVQNGIDIKRLKARGYGETMPIVANQNPDGTDNPDARQKNRRTSFKIIGELQKGTVVKSQNVELVK